MLYDAAQEAQRGLSGSELVMVGAAVLLLFKLFYRAR